MFKPSTRIAAAALFAAVASSPAIAQTATGQSAPPVPTRATLISTLDAGFNNMDADKNGTLSQTEIAAAEAKIVQSRIEQLRVRMDAEFTKADTNKDGQLSKAEFMAAVPQAPSTPASGAEILARFDTNKDGKLSAEEFRAPRVTAFDAIDTNRDGTLSIAERQAAENRARR